MNLKVKIFYSLLSFLMLISCVSVLLWQYMQFLQVVEQRQLRAFYDSFTAEIASKGQSAVSIAATLASQPSITTALQNNQREVLLQALTPTWNMLRQQYDVKQLQFHTPNAKSYLRMHAPEIYGDSLRDFRFTVLQALTSAEPVAGLERGVYGIGIRGVVPVFNETNSEIIASVEIGFAFDQAFIDNFKAKHGIEISLFLLDQDLSLFATSWLSLPAWRDLSPALDGVQIWRSKLDDSTYSHYSFKLQDFSDKTIGIIDIAMDRSFYRNAAIESISLASIIIIIALVIIYFLNRSFFRLKNKAELVRRQHAELNKSELQNSSMLSYIIEKEKMASLGQIVSGVAHEINTPLGVAITANSINVETTYSVSEKLQRQALTKSNLSEYLLGTKNSNVLIASNLSRMSVLIEKFKRLSVGKRGGEQQTFSLHEVVESVTLSLASTCAENDLTIVTNINININIQDSSLEFINLVNHMIINTLQHGLNSTGGTELLLSASIDSDLLMISCEDNGPGVSQDNLRHIFEPFFTTARNKACTGLGLSIMYNVVTQKYGGSISALSPGSAKKGLKLMLTLPVSASVQGKGNSQAGYVVGKLEPTISNEPGR